VSPTGERGGAPRGDAGRGRADAETAPEALARARRHARAALAESLCALHALLDALSLAASGEPARARRRLGPLARTLEALASDLDGAASEGQAALLDALAEALDAEIVRWESRARDDADARAVLRAFLGVRELLWELGVRRPEPPARSGPGPARARPAAPRGARGPRVQRVRVEG
jgi:hypothetical protein